MTPPSDNGGNGEEVKHMDASSADIEKDDVPSSGPHLKFQVPESFPKGEFIEDFAPLDDAVSVTSEDVEPYPHMPKQEKYGNSMDKVFPIIVNNKGKVDKSKETPKVFSADNGRATISRSLTNQEGTLTRYSPQFQGVRAQQSNGPTSHDFQDTGRFERKNGFERYTQNHNSIIRREMDHPTSPLSKMLENSSSFTIRLTEF